MTGTTLCRSRSPDSRYVAVRSCSARLGHGAALSALCLKEHSAFPSLPPSLHLYLSTSSSAETAPSPPLPLEEEEDDTVDCKRGTPFLARRTPPPTPPAPHLLPLQPRERRSTPIRPRWCAPLIPLADTRRTAPLQSAPGRSAPFLILFFFLFSRPWRTVHSLETG